MAGESSFTIPDPKPLDPEKPIDQQNLLSGTREQDQLGSKFPGTMRHYFWLKRFILMPSLFLFVISLNVWWDHSVMRLIRESGMNGSGFHLSDSVLIALITTSIANFLVLVHIVAKNLFPPSGA